MLGYFQIFFSQLVHENQYFHLVILKMLHGRNMSEHNVVIIKSENFMNW